MTHINRKRIPLEGKMREIVENYSDNYYAIKYKRKLQIIHIDPFNGFVMFTSLPKGVN